MPDDLRKVSVKEVAAALRVHIEQGSYLPGRLLPSEPVLAEQLGYSRHAIRKGMEELRRQGLIETHNGRGSALRATHVNKRTKGGDPAADLEPLADPVPARDIPSAAMLEAFGIRDGSQLFRLEQLCRCPATKVPVLTVRYVPAEVLHGIRPTPNPVGEREPLIAALAGHYGPLTTEDQFRVIPRPSPVVAASLDMQAGDLRPVMEISRMLCTGTGRLLMVEVEASDAAAAEWRVTY
jgi:DNA-binding GntR family transcriptional regulator